MSFNIRRIITVAIIIIVCFLLQCTLFQSLEIASISPNLMLIVTSSFGFMRGRKEGMIIGFFCGLISDIFFGDIIGFYALLYMLMGLINGAFKKMFYPDDIKLPMTLIGVSDLILNIFIYFFLFLFRSRFHFIYYFLNIMLPELVYTMVVTLVLYFIILKINNHLEEIAKRSASKFV